MMEVNSADTALVITDPQNDFLSPKGVFWDAVKASVSENNTIENIDTMFRSAKRFMIWVIRARVTPACKALL